MAFNYNSGTNSIPLNKFEKLCSLAKVEPDYFGKFELKEVQNQPHSITVPPLDSEELSEFLGFMAGDGCLTVNYAVVVSCDATSDKRYVWEVVAPKFMRLFSLAPNIRKINRNLLQCRVYCKKLFDFLSKEAGLPTGRKKNKIRIPEFIMPNKTLTAAFLRGLFDTDGGFHRHNPFSSKVEFTSYSEKFREDIVQALISLGFKPVSIKTRIYIMAKSEIARFFATIKPSNFKHCYKYAKFLEKGQVPRHRDIDYNSEEFKNFGLL